ncbi:Protein MIZU-KUSSEI 1 [Vitis vinifera]|uniref:Protein MIZU-KUSSEI 1 n=1 Tax=Vitis vinifera TaxID=29760 RepID=A0A438BVX2_VITVI|nr:Protein MIZU-KUSSEI 1 [Vitis vinifera]
MEMAARRVPPCPPPPRSPTSQGPAALDLEKTPSHPRSFPIISPACKIPVLLHNSRLNDVHIHGGTRMTGLGLVRIALECEKRPEEKIKLMDEPIWNLYCNGRKMGYAVKREANAEDLNVMQMLHAVSMGAANMMHIQHCNSQVVDARRMVANEGAKARVLKECEEGCQSLSSATGTKENSDCRIMQGFRD